MWIVVQTLFRLYSGDRLDVIVNFVRGKQRVGFRRDESDWRIIDALLVGVFVSLDRPLPRMSIAAVFPFSSRHLAFTPQVLAADCIPRRMRIATSCSDSTSFP